MVINYKLYYKYVLSNSVFAFVNNLSQRSKNTNLLFGGGVLFFTATHMRMSSPFYSSQLCDMFAYEVPGLSNGTAPSSRGAEHSFKYSYANKPQSTLVVYNFHSLFSQDRFFLFVHNTAALVKSRALAVNAVIDSITELFPAANWLEREIAELHGMIFNGKKDLRNLMLQYGDTSAPFQKSFPSVGLKEMFYDPIKDTITQNGITIAL